MGNGRIFINYRRDDSRADSGRIYDHLKVRFPNRVFRDISSADMEPGDDWHKAIGRAVSNSDAFIVVIGCKWLDIQGDNGHRRLDDPSDTVRQEIFAALQRGVRVIPALVGGAKMPKRESLPLDLQPLCDRQALEMNDPGWEESCAKLDRAIEIAIAEANPAQIPATPQYRTATPSSSGRMKWIIAGCALAVVLTLGLIGTAVKQPSPAPSPIPVTTTTAPQAAPEPSNPKPPVVKPRPQPVSPAAQPVAPADESALTTSNPVATVLNPAGNWMAQAILNGVPYSSNIQLYRDHSFRNVHNGLTESVGTWQVNDSQGLDFQTGTTLSSGVHFSCNIVGGGLNLQGSCTNAVGYSWNFTMLRTPGPVLTPSSPPRVDVSALNMAELVFLNQRLSTQPCVCRCGMTVQRCLLKDATCNYSPQTAAAEVARLLRTTRY